MQNNLYGRFICNRSGRGQSGIVPEWILKVVEQIAGTYGYGNDGNCCSRIGKTVSLERAAMLPPGA